MNRLHIASLALSLSLVTLSCSKQDAGTGAATSASAALPPITAAAAAAFARAQVEGPGGSLILDVDGLRELGGRTGDVAAQQGDLFLEFAVELLPSLAAELKDDPSAGALARAAVLLGLVREWAYMPVVRRLGVVAQVDPANPDQAPDGVLVLLAVKESEQEGRELLQAMGAAIRASTGQELIRTEQGYFCVAREATPELPFQACLSAGPGLFALGTAKALATLSTAPTAPAAQPPPGAAPEPLLRLLARMPGMGRVKITMEGRGPIRVAGVVEPEDPAMAQQIEAGIQAGLRELDAQAERRRVVMERALGEVKGSIAKDPEAPPRMKAAVAGATTDKLLDPRGEYAALRKSIQVARSEKSVTVELSIPEAQVKRFARIDQGMTTVATVGVLAAIAIPNFIKYQCRAKASEARVRLKEAMVALEEARMMRGRFPDRLQQTDYRPPPSGRYALCMRAGCLPPPSPEAEAACRAIFASAPKKRPESPLLCAAGKPGDGGTMDVWTISTAGEVANVRSGCQ